MTKEEIQNIKDRLGLNSSDEDLSGAGIKLKRVFELLEQAQMVIECYRQALMEIGAKHEPPASKIANDALWKVDNTIKDGI